MLKKRSRTPAGGRRIRLRPHNSFDLIRLIASGQSDARKAVAELVQNALDAGAATITITRQRRRGEVVLAIADDGDGVFPDLEREAALERLATNVGHSFKKNFSPAERQAQMLAGKYGIGLLGFWAIGREFEMRTRVAASPVWCLRLQRNEPDAEVHKAPQRQISFDGETWTEVVIRGVHAGVFRQLSGRRLGDYLGSELRGQLLARDVKLRVIDRVARGTAAKDFLVVPSRFQGKRVRAVDKLEVPGFAGATLELYFVAADDERRGVVALHASGTLVSEDIGAIDGYELDPAVWASGRFEGIVEFQDLEVAPTTRREFVRNEAADRLFEALRGAEPRLREVLEEHEEKRQSEEDQSIAQEIRKIFRPLTESLPQYDFFDVDGDAAGERSGESDRGARLGRRDDEPEPPAEEGAGEATTEDIELGDEPEPPAELLPPGPLSSVRIVPKKCRLLTGATRALMARAVDDTGRVIPNGVEYTWSIVSGEGTLGGDGARATLKAPSEVGVVRIAVTAREERPGEQIAAPRTAEAEAEVHVVAKLRGENPDAGIPDPKRVFDPHGDWRSRLAGRRWEYNAAHPDYQAVLEDPKRRLRYLTHLFCKEIVLRNYGEPKDERLLERMVEVLTYIKRGV